MSADKAFPTSVNSQITDAVTQTNGGMSNAQSIVDGICKELVKLELNNRHMFEKYNLTPPITHVQQLPRPPGVLGDLIMSFEKLQYENKLYESILANTLKL